jgi:hypothetical protein
MSRRIRVFLSRIVVLSLPIAVFAGCSSDPNAPGSAALTAPDVDLEPAARPGSTSGSGWYPLTLGSLWNYDHRFSVQVTPTGGVPGTEFVDQSQVIHDLIVTEDLFGRTYVVELQRTEVEGQTPVLEFVRYRQDRAGLYEADVPMNDPPGNASGVVERESARGARAWTKLATTISGGSQLAAYRNAYEQIAARRAVVNALVSGSLETYARPGGGGVLPGETQRLKYSLKPGAAWTLRADPLITSVCEAREELTLPAGTKRGYRVRLQSAFFGPQDRIYFWYSTEGLLQFSGHFEGEATDEQGNVIGTVVGEDRKVLTSVKLGTQG